MSALREMQMVFADSVIFGDEGRIAPAIRSNGLPAGARVAIYHNNFCSNLVEALRATYPVVEKLVGEDFLRYAAKAYISVYPSEQGNLQDYGGSFGDFLASFVPAAVSLPYLADVARLEWAWHVAFHAVVDERRFDVAGLAHVSDDQQDGLRFDLHASAQLLASPYPVLRIWEVNQEGRAGDSLVDLAEGAGTLLVLQRNLHVEIFSLSKGEYLLLEAFSEGRGLGEAFEIASAHDEHLDLGETLRRHIQLGTLAGWHIEPNTPSTTSSTEHDHVHEH